MCQTLVELGVSDAGRVRCVDTIRDEVCRMLVELGVSDAGRVRCVGCW